MLNAVGYEITSWQFWCFLATYWAVSKLSRERGQLEGMIQYLDMSDAEQREIRQAVARARKEQS